MRAKEGGKRHNSPDGHVSLGGVRSGEGEDDDVALTMHQTRQGDSFGVEKDKAERMQEESTSGAPPPSFFLKKFFSKLISNTFFWICEAYMFNTRVLQV